ncbi:hypothetical protein AUC71_12250 [Methyloceanibacter marginalis]|uniref:CYTH domain-containing protein n=1 Tax=Methyloceanibacter marginalis TaxID=1774971 RepID=A0A1E3WB21_9HYPH|nr:hypothetical protein AUC71_12250 [Methyloceanibacter marginalis]
MAAGKPEHEATEIELKLTFDPADHGLIAAHPILDAAGAPNVRELISTYYDTGEDALREAGVFLRVRATGDGYVQTIKTARGTGEFLERDEWECSLRTHALDLDAAAGTALEPLLTAELRAALSPRFHTRFRRKAYQLAHEGAEIELAVDEGEITAGIKAAPICELELELKSGDRRALFSLAKALAETVPLTLGVKTKAERGFELLDDGDQAFEKAQAVIVTPEMSCAQAFRTVARNCLRQIIVNAPAMGDGRPEALHQMRVGLRRLRAAIALFGDVVADRDREAVTESLKWIGGELGPARDLDVFAPTSWSHGARRIRTIPIWKRSTATSWSAVPRLMPAPSRRAAPRASAVPCSILALGSRSAAGRATPKPRTRSPVMPRKSSRSCGARSRKKARTCAT